MLEDLVAAAFNDARARADAVTGEEMQRVQAAAGIPPGFKLPGCSGRAIAPTNTGTPYPQPSDRHHVASAPQVRIWTRI